MHNTQSILLLTHGEFEQEFLNLLKQNIVSVLHCSVSIEENHLNIDDYYDISRRQYDANKLLKTINNTAPSPFIKQIGLFRIDLFIPILTYIFGQAVFKGTTGVASLYRLRNEHYGMKKDNTLLANRFTKVIIHELGHTFGLIHCHVPACVMRSSTYVEDLDQKNHSFCSQCAEKMIGHF